MEWGEYAKNSTGSPTDHGRMAQNLLSVFKQVESGHTPPSVKGLAQNVGIMVERSSRRKLLGGFERKITKQRDAPNSLGKNCHGALTGRSCNMAVPRAAWFADLQMGWMRNAPGIVEVVTTTPFIARLSNATANTFTRSLRRPKQFAGVEGLSYPSGADSAERSIWRTPAV